MKALKYLFIAMLPLGFMACGDEDDEADKLEDPATTVHTQLQKDAQAYFQGEWVATPVKNRNHDGRTSLLHPVRLCRHHQFRTGIRNS